MYLYVLACRLYKGDLKDLDFSWIHWEFKCYVKIWIDVNSKFWYNEQQNVDCHSSLQNENSLFGTPLKNNNLSARRDQWDVDLHPLTGNVSSAIHAYTRAIVRDLGSPVHLFGWSMVFCVQYRFF